MRRFFPQGWKTNGQEMLEDMFVYTFDSVYQTLRNEEKFQQKFKMEYICVVYYYLIVNFDVFMMTKPTCY